MNKPLILSALLVSSAAAMAGAAMAGAPGETPKASEKEDPNQMICRREPVIGSRTNMQRVCHTRGQWAEMRRVNRQALDQATAQKPSSGN